MDRALARWKKSTSRSGQYSNFGPLWHEACEVISARHNRIALVCSSGTDAVRLAIAACKDRLNSKEDTPILVEGFTFEGTRLAADSIGSTYYEVGTGEKGNPGSIIVRTVPFGMHRVVKRTPGMQVVDMAGAFSMAEHAFDHIDPNAVIACSFHATKNYPIGEGGVVMLPASWTREATETMWRMNFGLNDKRIPSTPHGTNAKIDELRCAVLLEQLKRGHTFAERSRRIVDHSVVAQYAIDGRGKLNYMPGLAQSMAVVSHEISVNFVDKLNRNGFAARRVYFPSRLANDKESSFVAIPADMTNTELKALIKVIKS